MIFQQYRRQKIKIEEIKNFNNKKKLKIKIKFHKKIQNIAENLFNNK